MLIAAFAHSGTSDLHQFLDGWQLIELAELVALVFFQKSVKICISFIEDEA
jgi:hypothetical protein